nr:hypothetical protein [Tanacetum cinerariifolium]
MEEEDSKALKRASESQAEKAAKKQKLGKEVEELKKHLQIVLMKMMFILRLPLLLARSLIEDLEVLWQLVKERFGSSKPKNFSDDFLLTTLTYMFEKPNVQAQVWKNQRTVHGLAVLWSTHHHIYNYTDDLAGREKISTNKVHFRSNAQQC